MVRGSNFRLLFRVIFFFFCLSFACFYHHGSGDDKQGGKLKGEHLNEDVFLKQDESVPNSTENAKHDDGSKVWKKAKLPRMVKKETEMKNFQNDGIRKISKLSFSTPSSPSLKVFSKELATTLHLSLMNSRYNSAQNISSLKDSIFHQNDLKKKVERERFVSLTTQHFRSKRDVNSTRNKTEEESRRNRTTELSQKYILDRLSALLLLYQLDQFDSLNLTQLLNVLDLFDRSGLSDLCNDSIINIKYDEEYKVWNNFSIFYKNKVYDYTEYRVLNDGIKICNSTDDNVRDVLKFRILFSFLAESIMFLNSCNVTSSFVPLYPGQYTVLKDFRVAILVTKQVLTRHDYAVFEGFLAICVEKLNSKTGNLIDAIILLCTFLLSYVSLLLLFIVYGMLPELRTLPGLNLMNLSFSFLLWQTYWIVRVLLGVRKVEMNSIFCAWKDITFWFTQFCTLTNSAVNVYHLRKTFCSNTLARSHEKKWKTFLKYSFFSWGVPVIEMIVNIVLVEVDVVRFSINIYGDCVKEQSIWLIVFGLLFLVLLLYIIVSFGISVYRLRQKLKASNSIAQASNNARNRNSLIVSLKLFSTTAITFWLPQIISAAINPNDRVTAALATISFLIGFYIGVAFVFTKKNYKLLKKKYLPAKNKP